MRLQKAIKDDAVRDRSRDAMQSLIKFAKSKEKSGMRDDLPLDEVQKAKEYFNLWKKRKMFENNKTIFFVITISILIFSFNRGAIPELSIIAMLVATWTIYGSLEWEKRKKVYVREMLGDLSSMPFDERHHFLNGLVFDLWRIEKEEIKKVFAGINFGLVLIFVTVALFLDLPEQQKIIALTSAGMVSILFFSNDIIVEKKEKIKTKEKKEKGDKK